MPREQQTPGSQLSREQPIIGGNKARGSIQDLPLAFEEMGASSRQAEWGDLNIALETMPAGLDTAPIFVGLPDDRCQCPHWGYVTNGRMRISYRDHDEVVSAGDAYYMAPWPYCDFR